MSRNRAWYEFLLLYYANFWTPAMRMPFCALVLHAGVSFHSRGPVNGSFVLNGPDDFVKVGDFCSHQCCFGLAFLEDPYSGGF